MSFFKRLLNFNSVSPSSSNKNTPSSSSNNNDSNNNKLPQGWEKHVDSITKHPYYVNAGLNITQWTVPNSSSAADARVLLQKLPPALSVAPVKPATTSATSVVPPHKDPCTNPYDSTDLYYYISPKNGSGPYIPQPTDGDIRDYARIKDGRTIWTQGTIPNTSATGCMTQDLGGYFGIQVDGLNKMIIDAYNAKFSNRPPIETLVPLETKYFYYVRTIYSEKEYEPRRLRAIEFALEGRRLSSDSGWGNGNPQNIPNTNATGFMTSAKNDTINKRFYVRVDRANNAIIEAYNESLKNPLPPGWEEVKQASGQIFYGNPTLKIVQEVRPTSEAPEPIPSSPLPPGWEYLKDDSGRIYYGNPVLKIKQYNRPDNLPPGWKEFREEASGKLYYKNTSGIVQYDRPLPPLPPRWVETKEWHGGISYVYPPLRWTQSERPLPLPPGWEYMRGKTGKLYYMNPSLYTAQYAFPTTPSSSSTPAQVAAQPLVPAQSTSSAPATPDLAAQPLVPATSAPAAGAAPLPPLPPGWEELKDENTGRISYGNRRLKTVQWDRPANLPPGWEELREPSGRIYYENSVLKVVQYELPMLYEMGNKTFSSTNELLNNIYSQCPTYTSECKVTAAPAAAAAGDPGAEAAKALRWNKQQQLVAEEEQRYHASPLPPPTSDKLPEGWRKTVDPVTKNPVWVQDSTGILRYDPPPPNGGAKNKKTSKRRSNRLRKASRRKASRRKASHRKDSRNRTCNK
jgi:hypothetical protein